MVAPALKPCAAVNHSGCHLLHCGGRGMLRCGGREFRSASTRDADQKAAKNRRSPNTGVSSAGLWRLTFFLNLCPCRSRAAAPPPGFGVRRFSAAFAAEKRARIKLPAAVVGLFPGLAFVLASSTVRVAIVPPGLRIAACPSVCSVCGDVAIEGRGGGSRRSTGGWSRVTDRWVLGLFFFFHDHIFDSRRLQRTALGCHSRCFTPNWPARH